MTYRSPFIGTPVDGSATRISDNAQVVWPDGLVNALTISCEWTPKIDKACTLLESGDIKLSYLSNVITFAKGAFTATVPYTFTPDVAIIVQGRLHESLGIDVFVDSVKGTGNADVTDAIPSAALSIGSDE